ncbi:MAG: Alanine racemase, partial [Gammaproteobacteria bacterium]|nr:Alanine racemase [Gammaproteobacteria bacterium]
RLRDNGIKQPIMVMGGFQDVSELKALSAQNIISVVHTPDQVSLLEETQLTKPMQIWMKIDTGMHRLGFSEASFPSILKRLTDSKNVVQLLGCMTHFSMAYEPDHPATSYQVACFDRLVSKTTPQSLANSAAIFTRPDTHRDLIRPGIVLYGVSPFGDHRLGKDFDLKPVMTLSAKLIDIHHCKKGDGVGYGGTWVCPEDMPVGLVSIGYADGYPRHARNGAPVLINGIESMLIGNVSMDFITIDLRGCLGAKPGDTVVLWGEGLPVERVARHAGTIAYELLAKVTARVSYEYINSL